MKENIKIVNKLEENTGPFKLLDEGKPFLLNGVVHIKLSDPVVALNGYSDKFTLNAFNLDIKNPSYIEPEQEIREVCISIYITK